MPLAEAINDTTVWDRNGAIVALVVVGGKHRVERFAL